MWLNKNKKCVNKQIVIIDSIKCVKILKLYIVMWPCIRYSIG